jgi:hypothetical protein
MKREAEKDLIELLKIMPNIPLVQNQNLSEMVYGLRVKYNVPLVRAKTPTQPVLMTENKIQITFNRRRKIIPITEEFDRDLRVWNEFALMSIESMMGVTEKYKETPIIDLPKNVSKDFFKINDIEKQYNIYDRKMVKKLILFINENFNVKIKPANFWWESYASNARQIDGKIMHVYKCNDL